MKKILMLVLSVCSIHAFSQQPSFKLTRQDENYSFLKKDSSRSWYEKIKYAPLSKPGNTYISAGGDIRYQYFNIKNEVWGDAPEDHDGFMFNRLLLHADFHAGKNFRAFVQLQSSMVNGKATTTPVDENPLEFHQAFIEYQIPFHQNQFFSLRAGRQEFLYGSQRIITVRDGPNNRLAFDAIKFSFKSADYLIDAFYSRPVAARKGVFDDKYNDQMRLWGAYLVKNRFFYTSNIDLYYLGIWKKNAVYDDGAGRELRHSFGTRIWNNGARWKYDIEGLYQFGKFIENDIKAWTASFNASYTITQLKYLPQLGLKFEWISGDKRQGDDQLNTFNPLFPRGAYFGLASLIGPANLIDLHPSVTFLPRKHVEACFDYDAFWRYSTHDGIYGPNVSLIYSGKNVPGKYIGQQFSWYMIYTPNNFISFRGEFTWFDAGDFLKAAGSGKDILFTGITAKLSF